MINVYIIIVTYHNNDEPSIAIGDVLEFKNIDEAEGFVIDYNSRQVESEYGYSYARIPDFN